jgi:hypothetical protein
MPATRNTQTGTTGQRHLGRGRRPRSGAAPQGPPDAGALAREAVISFLQDASKATAEREALRAGAAAAGAEATVTAAAEDTAGDGASMADGVLAASPEPEAMPWDAIFAASPVAESEAGRLAAISAAALDRIEAAAAKVEADIAVAHRAYPSHRRDPGRHPQRRLGPGDRRRTPRGGRCGFPGQAVRHSPAPGRRRTLPPLTAVGRSRSERVNRRRQYTQGMPYFAFAVTVTAPPVALLSAPAADEGEGAVDVPGEVPGEVPGDVRLTGTAVTAEPSSTAT